MKKRKIIKRAVLALALFALILALFGCSPEKEKTSDAAGQTAVTRETPTAGKTSPEQSAGATVTTGEETSAASLPSEPTKETVSAPTEPSAPTETPTPTVYPSPEEPDDGGFPPTGEEGWGDLHPFG